MTQSSRPQADHISNFPLPSDPGPYSADQWAQYMQIVYTTDQQTVQGPVVRYLNELGGADNGSNQVTVDTGAGIVNGHLLISSEQETWAIPAGPVATRIDRVVMVENNTNVEVTQTVAGRPLLFPADLSEYTATPGVPAYSARLAIVRGADGAGLPGIDQTTALYMVELYRYTINNVPAISSATDYRTFCHFGSTIGTRTAWIPCINTIDGGTHHWGEGALRRGAEMPDAVTSRAYGSWQVPTDFRESLTIKLAVTPAGTGNMWARNLFAWSECGQAISTHTLTPALAAAAVTNNNMDCVYEETLTPVVIGDIITIEAERQAGVGTDTVNASVYAVGWIATYEALD